MGKGKLKMESKTNTNIVDIENLPTASMVSLDDTIYIGTDTNTLLTCKISDLSAYFISGNKLQQLQQKMNELLVLKNSFIKFIKNNYPSLNDVYKKYVKTGDFNNYYNNMMTIYTILSDGLEEYCSKTYANYLKILYNNEVQQEYNEYIDEISDTALDLIDIEYEM